MGGDMALSKQRGAGGQVPCGERHRLLGRFAFVKFERILNLRWFWLNNQWVAAQR
jgi:hypothetical protein